MRPAKHPAVAERIRRRLASAPDAVLPAERTLARELGVARSTLRQALAALRQQGLIERAGARAACAPARRRRDQAPPPLHVVQFHHLGPLSANPFLAELVAALAAQAAAAGGGLALHHLGPGQALDGHLAACDRAWLAAGGVVAVGPPDDLRSLLALRQQGVPVVLVGDPQQPPGLPVVGGIQGEAAARAVRHLAGHGHRRLALADGPFANHYCRQRREAVQRTLAELGLPPAAELETVGWFLPTGAAAAERLLRLSPRPTAVLCYGDYAAIGLIQALDAAQVRIPGDLAVMGIDCHPLTDHITDRALSRFANDFAGLAAAAVACLEAQRRGAAAIPPAAVPLLHLPGTTCGCAAPPWRERMAGDTLSARLPPPSAAATPRAPGGSGG